MARISTLHINNFKFFGESEPIDVGGKHLLIYGENGSGKSSIYWALFTLLECSRKVEAAIRKYFDKNHERSLVNIHANVVGPDDWNSFISAVLDDGTEYRIAVTDTSLNKNILARESSRASDFLTYRFAYKLHDFRHGQEIELFELFLKEIFPYTSTKRKLTVRKDTDTNRRDTQDLRIAWNYLDRGLTRHNNSQRRRVHYNSFWAREYKKLATDFDAEVLAILGDIITFGNQVLKKLGYPDIKFTLDYSVITFDRHGDAETPTIKLRITEFDGQENPFKFPHSFLNEARLTAIALAIRLGFLESRLSNAELKLLVLDDLLISLDMSNRRKVLDLLITQYAPTYQVFILTHDRAFYEKAKRQISARNEEDNWKYFEMYEDTQNIPARPFIKKSDSLIDRAGQHFVKFDFPAAANYLRKACEQLLEELLPLRYRLDGNGEKIWQLDTLLVKADEYFKKIPVSSQPVYEIQEHLKTLLNPLSHADLEAPIYRQELSDVFKSYHELALYKKLQRLLLSAKDEHLTFALTDYTKGGNALTWNITLNEDLAALKLPEEPDRLAYCKFMATWAKDGIDNPKPIVGQSDLTKFYEDACRKTGNIPVEVMDALVTADGQPLRDKLNSPTGPMVSTAE
ncbi:hypothetical protein BH09BAC4_BH09BAC4_08660 [soil metagenome]